jgi:hypothetical protein
MKIHLGTSKWEAQENVADTEAKQSGKSLPGRSDGRGTQKSLALR